MERQFARLRRGIVPDSPDYSVVPVGGMCLNVFLVVRPPEHPGQVLLGKVDPSAPWRDLSALGPDRLSRLLDRWVLPASQLLLFESPDDGARRVAREQLAFDLTEVPLPHVFSETYTRAESEVKDPHWDVHFVYEIPWPKGRAFPAAPWKELRLVDVGRTSRAQFGRGHADVLDLIGVSAAP